MKATKTRKASAGGGNTGSATAKSARNAGTGHATSGSITEKDTAVNPSHYHGDLVMRIAEHFNLDKLDFQVLKYILRSGQKPGEPASRDYKKALWYLARKIHNLEHPDEVGRLI